MLQINNDFLRVFLFVILIALISLQSLPISKILASTEKNCCTSLKNGSKSCGEKSCPMTRSPRHLIQIADKVCGGNRIDFSKLFLTEQFSELSNAAFLPDFELKSNKHINDNDFNDFVSSECSSHCCINYLAQFQGRIFSIATVVELNNKPRPPTDNFVKIINKSETIILSAAKTDFNPRAPPQTFIL